MSEIDFWAAVLGGLVGGSISAGVTWLWTHGKWEEAAHTWKKTAHSFKTTARYLMEAVPHPSVEAEYNDDGWLTGLKYKEEIEESTSVSSTANSSATRQPGEENDD